MDRLWLIGLIETRAGRILGSLAGVALTVALLAALGAFLRMSAADMTARSVAAVPVDWQVQLLPDADLAATEEMMRKSASVSAVQAVGYADVEGFEASADGTVQTTGAGKVLGVDPGYFATFPGEVRLLLGTLDGVVVAQQTAANLHVAVGDTIVIHRVSAPDAQVTVAGIAELPNADQLFQAIGVPPGAAPQAPPDNVLILPMPLWHQIFDPQRDARPDTARLQLQARLDHKSLAEDPVAASAFAADQGRSFEARAGGTALLANNLAARLGAVREDALYARVLFLFLGAPGAILAVLMTLAVAASGTARRRRDQALLRLRGASPATVARLASAEALVAGIGGAAAGTILAEIASRIVFGGTLLSIAGLPSLAMAFAGGVALAVMAILLPAWGDARRTTVAAARLTVGRDRPRLWMRVYLDIVLLALAGLSFWRSASAGYQVVLAPEGIAATSVDYAAFLAPVLLWTGLGLLTIRIADLGLRRGRPVVARAIRPVAGLLSEPVATSFARQSRCLTAGVAMTALAFAFAGSTAIFNTTYEDQARVDAQLTNGADVAVTGTGAVPASLALDMLSRLPETAAAEPMQHRYAYVGSDLQDLYGVDPARIAAATDMSNAYFASGGAAATLAELARTPDGVLVSQETVNDYQLSQGDVINLRLQSASDHQYHEVPFHIVGVVREFPTAPKDSFLVANAAYVAARTGAAGGEIVLMRAAGDPMRLARAARLMVGHLPGMKVTQIGDAMATIGSSLTAVNLAGLTRLELGFALVMAAAAAGLVLALGLADRQRSFAILVALGAKPRQLGAFVWSEMGIMLLGGAAVGLLGGGLVAYVLVKLLTGVFDPPPEALSVPWSYLAVLILAAATAAAFASIGATARTHAHVIEKIRGER